MPLDGLITADTSTARGDAPLMAVVTALLQTAPWRRGAHSPPRKIDDPRSAAPSSEGTNALDVCARER